MWVITQTGFYSVVRYRIGGGLDYKLTDRQRKLAMAEALLVVRARARKDLAKLCARLDDKAEIIEQAGTDYPYRVFLSKYEWADFLMDEVDGIDYSNFKSRISAKDPQRAHVLMTVWSDLHRLTSSKDDSEPKLDGGHMDLDFQELRTHLANEHAGDLDKKVGSRPYAVLEHMHAEAHDKAVV